MRCELRFFFSICGYAIVPAPVGERISIFLLNCLHYCWKTVFHLCVGILTILFHGSICLFLHPDYLKISSHMCRWTIFHIFLCILKTLKHLKPIIYSTNWYLAADFIFTLFLRSLSCWFDDCYKYGDFMLWLGTIT